MKNHHHQCRNCEVCHQQGLSREKFDHGHDSQGHASWHDSQVGDDSYRQDRLVVDDRPCTYLNSCHNRGHSCKHGKDHEHEGQDVYDIRPINYYDDKHDGHGRHGTHSGHVGHDYHNNAMLMEEQVHHISDGELSYPRGRYTSSNDRKMTVNKDGSNDLENLRNLNTKNFVESKRDQVKVLSSFDENLMSKRSVISKTIESYNHAVDDNGVRSSSKRDNQEQLLTQLLEQLVTENLKTASFLKEFSR